MQLCPSLLQRCWMPTPSILSLTAAMQNSLLTPRAACRLVTGQAGQTEAGQRHDSALKAVQFCPFLLQRGCTPTPSILALTVALQSGLLTS